MQRHYFLGLLLTVAAVFNFLDGYNQNAPRTTAVSVEACRGGMASIPVKVSDFNEIRGFSLRLNFDPVMLTFLDLSNKIFPDLTVSQESGVLVVTYNSPGSLETLPDGSTLFNLDFAYHSGTPQVTFDNSNSLIYDCAYIIDAAPFYLYDEPTGAYYTGATVTRRYLSNITGLTNPLHGSEQTYSVLESAGAHYQWVIPSDWTIISGQGTHSVNVVVGTESGTVTIISNTCVESEGRELAVQVVNMPAIPFEITGNDNPCDGSMNVYTITCEPGMYYSWELPEGWHYWYEPDGCSINASTGYYSGDIVVKVTNIYGETVLQRKTITVNHVPEKPTITGPLAACFRSFQTYSVDSVPGVSYYWEVPEDWSRFTPDNPSSVVVMVGQSAGEFKVTPINVCGWGTESDPLAVSYTTVPEIASAITGDIWPCPGSTQEYSVTNESGVVYFWEVPEEWTLISGQHTSSVTVEAGDTYGGYMFVTTSNACGDGPKQFLSVNLHYLPYQPFAIDGAASTCPADTKRYGVIENPNFTFNWQVPAGWMINSGQTTNLIEVTAGTTGGNVQVVLSNACGEGPPIVLPVSVIALDSPSKPSGTELVDLQYNTTTSYSTPMVDGAAGYLWSLEPAQMGTVIASGNQATINWLTIGTARLTVATDGDCVDPASEELVIEVDNSVAASNEPLDKVLVYPNPVNEMVFIKNLGPSSRMDVSIHDLQGSLLPCRTSGDQMGTMVMDVSELASGSYFLRVIVDNAVLQKILIKY